MSIETTTLDEFMQLTPEEHQEAIDLYDQAIHESAKRMAKQEAASDAFFQESDKLGRYYTLRKVHQVRWDELDAEANETDGATLSTAPAHGAA